jgi:vacuolar-type H+-ATPase subunit H
MIPITNQLAKLRDYVGKIEDILDTARAIPFSGRVSVDKDDLHDVLDQVIIIVEDMQKDLPSEIQHAKRIIADSDKIVADSRSKAAMIISNANDQIDKLTDEHEITKRATEQAAQIVDEGRRTAREMRINAIAYADEILDRSELTIREAIDMVSKRYNHVIAEFSETADLLYSNRQELRGSHNKNSGN